MGKSKSKESYSQEKIPFLTDLSARERGLGIGARFWDTLGTAGKEPVGNIGFNPSYLGGDNPSAAFFPALRKGEINPYVETTGKDGKTSKSMFEYYASPARPQLPKELRDQYDVVFAGTREPNPAEEVWNTKTSSRWSQGPQSIWQFIPKDIPQKQEQSTPAPVAVEPVAEAEDDRPVSIGTLTYNDPSRFLGEYIRSIGVSPV